MILFRTPLMESQFFQTGPHLQKAVMAIVSESDNNGPDWLVTAVVKDSPSHRGLRSIDIAPRLRSNPHPIERGESIRMTDRRLMHAWLVKIYQKYHLKVCLAIENDHYHIDDIHDLGVHLYDNPRPEYNLESHLLPGGFLHTPGLFDFRKMVAVWTP